MYSIFFYSLCTRRCIQHDSKYIVCIANTNMNLNTVLKDLPSPKVCKQISRTFEEKVEISYK